MAALHSPPPIVVYITNQQSLRTDGQAREEEEEVKWGDTKTLVLKKSNKVSVSFIYLNYVSAEVMTEETAESNPLLIIVDTLDISLLSSVSFWYAYILYIHI